MASKPKPAKPAASGSPPAAKKPRKAKQPSMTLAQKFNLLEYVKNADQKLPDASVAEAATGAFGRKVLASSVREYRKQFGIASVAKPSVSELMAHIAVLSSALISAGRDVPPFAVAQLMVSTSGDHGGSTEKQAA